MKTPLLLLGLLLVGGLTGCVEEKKVKTSIQGQGPSSLPESVESVESASVETPPAGNGPSLTNIESDIQELEDLITDLESEENLNISELLILQ
jgi:hypothetical protein